MTTDTLDIGILDQFDKDTLYIDAHRSEWLDSYSDCWVGRIRRAADLLRRNLGRGVG